MRARLVAVFAVSIVAAATLVPSGSAVAAVKLDNGVGTPAALNNPQCDKTLERVKFVYQAWLPCVKPWKDGADNGGATHSGRDRGHHQDRRPQAVRTRPPTRAGRRSRTARAASSRPWRTRRGHASRVREGLRAVGSQVRGEGRRDVGERRSRATRRRGLDHRDEAVRGDRPRCRRRVRVRHRGTQDPVDQPDDRHQRTEHSAVAVSVDGGRGPRRERGARRRVRRQGAQRQAGGVRR